MIAFISICVIVVFSVACTAACSLVNYYNAPQRQKSAKAVAIPMIVLAVVCILEIAVVVYLVWFVTAETLPIALFLAFSSIGILIAVCRILYSGASGAHYSINQHHD